MKQFSIYLRYFDSRAKAEAAAGRLAIQIPVEGAVSVLFITDKQFGQMRNYLGRVPTKVEQKPAQFTLF